jgi:hypothetical protein
MADPVFLIGCGFPVERHLLRNLGKAEHLGAGWKGQQARQKQEKNKQHFFHGGSTPFFLFFLV